MEVGVGSWVRSGQGGRPLLAVDTSTDRAAVAVASADGALHVAPIGESPRHGRGLLGSVRDLLREAGLRADDLAAIGVGLGPGSFTGLRIGLTAAKTLAYAVGCPVFEVDSLEAIAGNATGDVLRVVAVIDAQRGDLFAADFARDAPGGPLRCVVPTRIERADAWPDRLEAGTLVLGPPLGRGEPTWPSSIVRGVGASGYPEGRTILGLMRERMAGGLPLDTWYLEPKYVRRSAAEEKALGAGA